MLNGLQTVIQFNEGIFDGLAPMLQSHFEMKDQDTTDTLTDQLLIEREHVTCWTCGSDVETSSLERHLTGCERFANRNWISGTHSKRKSPT